MLGKIWKKVLFVILIIVCLFDITSKLVKRNSFKEEIKATIEHIYNKEDQSSVENKDEK